MTPNRPHIRLLGCSKEFQQGMQQMRAVEASANWGKLVKMTTVGSPGEPLHKSGLVQHSGWWVLRVRTAMGPSVLRCFGGTWGCSA